MEILINNKDVFECSHEELLQASALLKEAITLSDRKILLSFLLISSAKLSTDSSAPPQEVLYKVINIFIYVVSNQKNAFLQNPIDQVY